MQKNFHLRIFTVDAFTGRLFHGNPAAVCILDDDISDDLKQCIASEMNLSETAFVVRQNGGIGLRWFTPVSEVDLCGHATLASAHILWQEGYLRGDEEAVFYTMQKGILKARKIGEEIILDFPAAKLFSTEHEKSVRNLFDVEPKFIGIAGNHFLVELPSEDLVVNYTPDFEAIARLPKYGLIITSSSLGEHDFVSRFFAPAVGVNEDPVTGSAHCALGPYWSAKLNKNKLVGYQASKRGGIVGVEIAGDRVKLKGKAVTFLSGNISVNK